MSQAKKAPVTNIRAESELNQARVKIELQQLAGELDQATSPAQRAEIHRLVDKWLDERLNQKGVHPADCGCHECYAVVSEALTRRRMSEDVADPEEWGTLR